MMSGNGHAMPEDLTRLLDLEERYWESRKERDAYEAKSTYASGETSRMNPVPRGIDPLGTDADYHYRTERNYFLHVERGRAAVRNHPLVEQAINRLIANLRLDDFRLQINSGDEEIDKSLHDDWKGWTGETQAGRNLCDYEGSRSFQQIGRQSFFNRVAEGDIVHLPTIDATIQTWESHHIRSPWGYPKFANDDQNGMVHGAEVANGRTVAYWITPFNLTSAGTLTQRGQARRFPVFDAAGNKITFWLGFRHRFFQRRGISRLSAPRDAMTGFDDLNYANIKSSIRRALISYLMQKKQLPGMQGFGGGQLPKTGDRYATQHGLGLESIIVEQMGEPAQVFKTPEGYEIEGWNANLPPQSWFEHSALLLTMLAVNLDLPLSFLLLDGSLVNFHGGRMTFDQVKLRMTQIQRDEMQNLWAPVYEWWLRLKLAPGQPFFDAALVAAVERGANPFRYTFRPRGWPYVKPAEDVAAEKEAERNNLKSRRRILSERGEDLDEVDEEILHDRRRLWRRSMEAAVEDAKDFPEHKIDVPKLAAEYRYGPEHITASGGQSQSTEQIAADQDRQAQTEEAAK